MNDDELLGRWAKATDPDLDPIAAGEVRAQADQMPPSVLGMHPNRTGTSRLLVSAAVVVALAVVGSLAYLSRSDDSTAVTTRYEDTSSGSGSGPSVLGKKWVLVSLTLNRGSLDIPTTNLGTGPTLDLTEPGQAQFTGCNLGRGAVQLKDGVLSTEGSWTAEEKGCTGSEGESLMEIDRIMGRALEAGVTAEARGSTLTLTHMAMVATFTDAGSAPEGATGTVRVRLAPSGRFIEGFDVALRFEAADGTVIAATRWTDFVRSTGVEGLDAYYDSVLDQPVPLGTVTVRADVVTGAAGPPAPPDPAGDLPCHLAIEVPDAVPVDVQVLLDPESDECLRLLPARPEPNATTTAPDTATTSSAPQSESSTTSTPTTTRPAASSLTVGTGYYVDVDLKCEAFELSGTWVLVDGDPSSWQPPGERHEGGTFTLDTPGTGTFLGDAEGTKQATFRLLQGTEEPACDPVPR